MKRSSFIERLIIRFRYPASLPEEIAFALGVEISNHLTFQEFVDRLRSPTCRPTKLIRFMPREEAEEAFESALMRERFTRNSLFSYYFNEGWIEFVLQFDDLARLRRVYLQYKDIPHDQGIEIPLQ